MSRHTLPAFTLFPVFMWRVRHTYPSVVLCMHCRPIMFEVDLSYFLGTLVLWVYDLAVTFFLQAAVIDGLLIPSEEATSLCVKGRDMTYCCGPYDPGLIQAKREKVLKFRIQSYNRSANLRVHATLPDTISFVLLACCLVSASLLVNPALLLVHFRFQNILQCCPIFFFEFSPGFQHLRNSASCTRFTFLSYLSRCH